jgi:predicted Zn-dependent protease
LNAFAVPGGYIYVHSGLIERAESVDELAGVLGHEIGHVRAHHMFKQMRKARLLSGLSLAAMILARGDQAATIGSQAVTEQMMLNFSRDYEREADQLGLNDMYKAGFNPQAMASFFQKILLEQRFNAAQVPPYLLMHPLTQDRIAYVEDLMRVLRMDQDRSSATPNHFRRIQAMIKSQTMRADDAIREYRRKIEKEPDRSEWHEFLGIIYLQNRQYEQAQSAYEQARSLNPADPFVHSDLALAYLNLGRTGEARRSLQRSLELDPNNARTYNALGKVSLREKSWQEAISYNQTAIRLSPEIPEAYYDIGEAYSGLGDQRESYYFLGVAYRYMEERERSMQYFERALKLFGKESSRGRMIVKAMGEMKEQL